MAVFPFNEGDLEIHYVLGNILGGSYMVDYQKINKMPPLRTGSVTTGQTAHGFIGYDLQSEGDLYIEFNDPDQGGIS